MQPTAPRNSSPSSCTPPLSWHVSVSLAACGSWAARVSCAASPDAKPIVMYISSYHKIGFSYHAWGNKWSREEGRAYCNNIYSMCAVARLFFAYMPIISGLAFFVFLSPDFLLLDGWMDVNGVAFARRERESVCVCLCESIKMIRGWTEMRRYLENTCCFCWISCIVACLPAQSILSAWMGLAG